MRWTLTRYRLGETVTDGVLSIPDHEDRIYTLERPWLPGSPGGMPFKSCVPPGEYELVRFTRPNSDLVLQLRNPDLGVYDLQGDVPPAGGRYLILIHKANWTHQIAGCIAVGATRTIDDEGRAMVTHSSVTMEAVMAAFSDDGPVTLEIREELGSIE